MTTIRLRWKGIVDPRGGQAWMADLQCGNGACYTIYRKGRKYSLVYWSGRSAIVGHHGPYSTLVGAKRAAWRFHNWK